MVTRSRMRKAGSGSDAVVLKARLKKEVAELKEGLNLVDSRIKKIEREYGDQLQDPDTGKWNPDTSRAFDMGQKQIIERMIKDLEETI